jgi:hypothetical protein
LPIESLLLGMEMQQNLNQRLLKCKSTEQVSNSKYHAVMTIYLSNASTLKTHACLLSLVVISFQTRFTTHHHHNQPLNQSINQSNKQPHSPHPPCTATRNDNPHSTTDLPQRTTLPNRTAHIDRQHASTNIIVIPAPTTLPHRRHRPLPAPGHRRPRHPALAVPPRGHEFLSQGHAGRTTACCWNFALWR